MSTQGERTDITVVAEGAPTVNDLALVRALQESQRLGMVGDRPVAEVIEHALAFVAPLAEIAGTVLDLGSGGGVPGLVVARARRDLRVILIDRRVSRTDHLRRLVARLGLGDRIEVLTVEASAARKRLEAEVDAVVARGFGPPAKTLRAAGPLLRANGLLVVSEPPSSQDERAPSSRSRPTRWRPALLGETGFIAVDHSDGRVAVLRRVQAPRP